METVNMVLCGLGGQGILFMTKILAHAAMGKGFNVLGAETHGMAQRGGSVVSHLRIGEVRSSLVRMGSAHFLLALEENEGYRNLPFLADNARMYVNTDSESFPRTEVKTFLDGRGIRYGKIAANFLAQKMNAPRGSNLALLGYFLAFGEGPFSDVDVRKTIEGISPDPFRKINVTLFDAGLKCGQEDLSI
jgi:indolepyruvate ferredoxin oxidoreductase beta subunit